MLGRYSHAAVTVRTGALDVIMTLAVVRVPKP